MTDPYALTKELPETDYDVAVAKLRVRKETNVSDRAQIWVRFGRSD